MHGFVCVYRCIVPDVAAAAAAVGASPIPALFPFQHAAMRLQIEQKLPVSVAVVVAALAVAAGKCEHFGQHSQVVAGELAQKVLVMMILNYS